MILLLNQYKRKHERLHRHQRHPLGSLAKPHPLLKYLGRSLARPRRPPMFPHLLLRKKCANTRAASQHRRWWVALHAPTRDRYSAAHALLAYDPLRLRLLAACLLNRGERVVMVLRFRQSQNPEGGNSRRGRRERGLRKRTKRCTNLLLFRPSLVVPLPNRRLSTLATVLQQYQPKCQFRETRREKNPWTQTLCKT